MRLEVHVLTELLVYVVLLACVVETVHGNEVSPPWITLRGCFNYSSGNETHIILNNEPTQCFKHCSGYAKIGLKNTTCICNPSNNHARLNWQCGLKCSGKSEVYCGNNGTSDDLISVYTTDTPLPDGLNGNTSYGYGYVVISGGKLFYRASENNTGMQYGYLCYDAFASSAYKTCRLDKAHTCTWEDAIEKCNSGGARPFTASDVLNCATVGNFDGTYWIGIYRDYPNSITTTSVSVESSKVSSTTTPRSRDTSTSWTYANNITLDARSTTLAADSSNGGQDITTTGDATIKIVVGIVFGALIPGAIIFVVVCKIKRLLCFKDQPRRNPPSPVASS